MAAKILIALAVAAAVVITIMDAERTRPAVQNRPVQVAEKGFVTSATCRSCHPGNHTSWHTSYHRTMTQVATNETILPRLEGVELSFAGTAYRFERGLQKSYVRKRPEGAAQFGGREEIVLLTGSHNLQVLWIESGHGRTLWQLPFAYIIAEKMWAPITNTFLMPPETKEAYSLGGWNGACMDCHVTQGRSRFVQGHRWDSQVTEFGISCEACHGEGQSHIAANRNPLRRWKLHLSGEHDDLIANAGRMSGPESALTCGQCHSVWAFRNLDEKIDFNRHGAAFRPGEEALEQRFVVQPAENDYAAEKEFIRRAEPDFFSNRFWPDGMIRVTGREYNGTASSPCFKGGDFSCLSCHEMHPDRPRQAALETWARTGQLRPEMDGDRACLQCHQNFAGNISAHTHHQEMSKGSSCYNCHMPHTTYGLLKAIRSHQVSSPSAQESVAHGRPNACNLCHLDKTLAWSAQKLQEWFLQPPPDLSEEDRTTSAAVRWLVKGDAGQRALIAWGMGWKPAQEISGRDWLYPYLVYTMGDPYPAVRFVAWKSLQTLPAFENHPFNYTLADAPLAEAVRGAYDKWKNEVRREPFTYPFATLLQDDGAFAPAPFEQLRAARDETPIVLAE